MDPETNLPFEHFPLVDAIDHEILMHRDAHFGGLFSIMLEYYRQEKKGVQPEFDIARIERLAALEEQLKQNLAALFLAAPEMQKVADAREAYQRLRAIYEVKKAQNSLSAFNCRFDSNRRRRAGSRNCSHCRQKKIKLFLL